MLYPADIPGLGYIDTDGEEVLCVKSSKSTGHLWHFIGGDYKPEKVCCNFTTDFLNISDSINISYYDIFMVTAIKVYNYMSMHLY